MPANRIFGPAQLTNAAATKYTVPAGIRAIIRHIRIVNPGAAINLTMSIGADAAGTRLYDAWPVPANSVTDHYFYTALAAAEIIQAFASVTTQLVVTIDADLEAA